MLRTKSRIVIVGGGASGVLAVRALAGCAAAEVVLVDPQPGRGLAYGGSEPQHLLNTRASNMSLDEAAPDHFRAWLNRTVAAGREDWTGEDFAPRKVYGDYLESHLRDLQAAGAVRLVAGRAASLKRQGEGWRVILAEGGALDADAVVLATGNPRPRPLAFPGREALAPETVIDDPWDEAALAAVPPWGQVLLVGAGLTAIDVAVSLLKRPGGVKLLAVSRRGQSPRTHDLPRKVLPQLHRPFPVTARDLYSRVRRLAEAVAGDDPLARHGVFLGLRPIVAELWNQLPIVERRRFLRHLRAWWEVERHRVAPQIASVIAQAEADGRYTVARGRIVEAEAVEGGGALALASGPQMRRLQVTRIINCTGPDWRVGQDAEPLLRSLIEAGGRPDALGLGFAVDAFGEVEGARGVYALGPLTRGTFFEITAVPEIRAKATRLAEHVAATARSLAAV